MRVTCGNCGKHYKLDGRLVGKKVCCKACGQSFVVALPAAEGAELESLLPGEDQSEVFQPPTSIVPTGANRSTNFNRPQAIGLWIVMGAAVVVLIGLVVIHPWSKGSDNASPAPIAAVAPQVESNSADSIQQPTPPRPDETTVTLGAFAVTVPSALPAPTFEPDPSDPDSENQTQSALARFGVVVWDLSSMGNGAKDIKFLVFKREDSGHDVPVAPVDPQTLQERTHDVFNGNSLRFLRGFYNDQPIVFRAYDHDCMVEIHLDAGNPAPAESLAMLEKMARSIRRIKPDQQPQPVTDNNSPAPVRWQLTQTQTFVGAYQLGLPDGAVVTRPIAGLDGFDVAVKKPDGTAVTVNLQFLPLPKEAFDEGTAKPVRPGTGISKQWVDINGFHFLKMTLHTASAGDVSIMYSTYQDGRDITVTSVQGSYDPDAAALVDLIVQSLKSVK